jgi:hypothetical protein
MPGGTASARSSRLLLSHRLLLRRIDVPPEPLREPGLAVGKVTEQGRRLFEAKRQAEGRKAEKLGVRIEDTKIVEKALGGDEP